MSASEYRSVERKGNRFTVPPVCLQDYFLNSLRCLRCLRRWRNLLLKTGCIRQPDRWALSSLAILVPIDTINYPKVRLFFSVKIHGVLNKMSIFAEINNLK